MSGRRAEYRPAAMQPPIGSYGLIGDTRSAALASSLGSIDWLCLPRFDSAPVFGRLVAGDRGGRFRIEPEDVRSTTRRYRDGSAVLETTWRTGTGELRLTEGMVADVSHGLLPQTLIVRRVECLGGEGTVVVEFDPRLDLRDAPERTSRSAGALLAEWGSLALSLATSPDLELRPGEPRRVRLRDTEPPLTFSLGAVDRSLAVLVPPHLAWDELARDDRWWRTWASSIDHEDPRRPQVVRSLVTLRLLTYSPSGAPVAAPTTSLPEWLGGERNWDYRYSWPRDASLGVTAFLACGKPEEAEAFLHWLLIASRLTRPRVGVLYDLMGREPPAERVVNGASGYRDSHPVRFGNAACDQHQLDVYGWVVEAAWQLVSYEGSLDRSLWAAVSAWADFAADHWAEPDAGIWERRDGAAHFVHSKLMAWQALERALRLATRYPARSRRRERWSVARERLAAEVRRRGIDPGRGVYVQAFGNPSMDAALLMLPSIEFASPSDPSVAATVDAIREELDAGRGLLYRYTPGSDGIPGGEGAFLACSFWLVRALCRLGRTDEAASVFEDAYGHATDLGLFAEQLDPSTGEHLGNFPQALTHASLVHAALAIRRATSARPGSRA